jgi:hypothetical protein
MKSEQNSPQFRARSPLFEKFPSTASVFPFPYERAGSMTPLTRPLPVDAFFHLPSESLRDKK